MSSASGCPPRVKLLALVAAGEHVPHLEVCEECASFVEAAAEAVSAFTDGSELERALAAYLDEIVADTPPHRWTSAIVRARELHRSVVIRELLRRADGLYGSNPRLGLDVTTAAVAICDAMVASGNAPTPELRFEALKEHSTLLRKVGALDDALQVLSRAWTVAQETDEHELHRAILSLCTAILYTEPDLARLDEAIELSETAAAILDVCGDRRRAVIARHTKAYALAVMNRFEAAIPLLRSVVAEIVDAGGTPRDAARAHALLALSLVNLGSHDEALQQARTAERLHVECGDVVDAARSAHVAARALAGMGHFAEARGEFTRTAETVFAAGMFDIWCLLRLDFITAALADDEGADIRADVEAVARVCMTVAAKESTRRQQYAAEALDYLRRLALRDGLTWDVVNHIRAFVQRNVSQPPIRFAPLPGAAFLM